MKFMAVFMMPSAGLDEWMKKPEEERKAEEGKMKADWDAWMASHKGAVSGTAGVGKPKRVTKDGVTDARNDLMMYSFVQAESAEAAAAMFEGHPHFGIPGASIEVMPVKEDIG